MPHWSPGPGHASVHLEPAPHVAVQGGERHVKAQVLFCPQVQLPSAQTPVHVVLSPQLTWQGPDMQSKVQWLSSPQVQSPSAQTPLQASLSPSHCTWHGLELHEKSHAAPARQWHAPSAHSAEHVEPLAHATVQGGDPHVSKQWNPSLQVQLALEQSNWAVPPLHEASKAKTAATRKTQGVGDFMPHACTTSPSRSLRRRSLVSFDGSRSAAGSRATRRPDASAACSSA
jgi:hypothetical protein